MLKNFPLVLLCMLFSSFLFGETINIAPNPSQCLKPIENKCCNPGPAGAKGPKGKKGHKGSRGPRGHSAFVNFGDPYVIWVDANTTSKKQNGTLSHPFSTIQAAIDQIESFPPIPPTDIINFIRGWTVIIANGVYNESVININGDNKRIFLLAFANIVIGDPFGQGAILNYNLTNKNVFGPDTPSGLSIGTVNVNDNVGFDFFGTINISNTGTNEGAFLGNFFNATPNGKMNVTGNGPMILFFNNANLGSDLVATVNTTIQSAINTDFSGNVTVGDYLSIENCIFTASLNLLTPTTPLPYFPNTITNTYFGPGTILKGTNMYNFKVDAYTNYWIINNGTTVLDASITVISDTTPTT